MNNNDDQIKSLRTIKSFLFLTLNGFYKGIDEDISWHNHGEDGKKYSETQLEENHILLFGRKTFEMMENFWTSSFAAENFPLVAKRMNEANKIVVSHSLKNPKWKNSSLLSGELISKIKSLKFTPGKNITILGSGSVTTQLSDVGLIDEYEFLIDPIVMGSGTSIFQNLKQNLNLKLVSNQVFKDNGGILLTYKRS